MRKQIIIYFALDRDSNCDPNRKNWYNCALDIEEINCDPNRKNWYNCALDIEDHLSANMPAAEDSRFVLGAE